MKTANWTHGMLRTICVGLLAAATLLTVEAGAYEHRRGTPSAGGRLQFGTTGGDSEWHEIFDYGFGGAIDVRQYIARDRAVGLTAEQQSFDNKTADTRNIGPDNSDSSYDKLQFQILMVDYYVYFNRMARTTPYLVMSGGFYRPQLLDKFKEAGPSGTSGEHVGYRNKEGYVLRGGVGLEYFLRRRVAIDSVLSAYYLSAPGIDGSMLTLQLGVGIHLYTR